MQDVASDCEPSSDGHKNDVRVDRVKTSEDGDHLAIVMINGNKHSTALVLGPSSSALGVRPEPR